MNNTISPSRIRLEASSVCQLKCPSCPNTSDAIYPVIGRGFLKLQDFESLLKQNPALREVELSNYGEPFLNPCLADIMRIAHEYRIALRMDTGCNLNTAHPEQLEGLVKYRVLSLKCSLDGASQETYAQYRVNGQFDQVIRNISIINEYKKKFHSSYPVMTWQFIIFGHNEHEIPLARKLAAELGMKFRLKLSWDEHYSPIQDADQVRRETGYASRSEYRKIHGLDLGHVICRTLWEQPQINWDGRILGCCRNFWGEFGGNAFTDGLPASLNTDRMRTARSMLTGSMGPRMDIPCATCDIYRDRVFTDQFVKRDPASRLVRGIVCHLKTNRWVQRVHKRGT